MNETTKQVLIATVGMCFIVLCHTAYKLVTLLWGFDYE